MLRVRRKKGNVKEENKGYYAKVLIEEKTEKSRYRDEFLIHRSRELCVKENCINRFLANEQLKITSFILRDLFYFFKH